MDPNKMRKKQDTEDDEHQSKKSKKDTEDHEEQYKKTKKDIEDHEKQDRKRKGTEDHRNQGQEEEEGHQGPREAGQDNQGHGKTTRIKTKRPREKPGKNEGKGGIWSAVNGLRDCIKKRNKQNNEDYEEQAKKEEHGET
ncbi:acidic leucine-rich nuclear phosphoprotein 32 family member B-like [Scylla paramamosain]|uniref:acidic leucine-rich nuclear phosphoprotein 32 family member B-like n=1 Tax=Scylla paramamosain TaxID=85552 RepID=UPI0030838B9C